MVQFNSEQLQHFISLKDYSLTQEKFELYHSEMYDMLITHPKPSNDELGKYYDHSDYISHTDANKSVFDKLYQLAKKNAISSKVTLLNSLRPESKSVLDIGTGTAEFLIAMKKNGWSVTGVEPNIKARSIATKKFKSTQNQECIIFESLKELQQESPIKFDVITLWHVLEHVPDVQSYIVQLRLMLKPNGTIIIAVPNFKSYDATYYGNYWAAYDVPRHLWHFSKNAIKLLFKNEQMEVVKIFPMKMDSFYVSLLSEKYKTGKMNFFKGFLIGLQSNIKALISDEYSSHIFIIKNKKNDLN